MTSPGPGPGRARSRALPRVLLCGGLEPEGRAGLLADAEAVRAQGAQPILAATALTAQGTRTFATRAVTPGMLEATLQAAREHGPIAAMKLGMVPSRALWRVIWRFADEARVRWVIVDPVVRTSRGQALSTLGPRDFLGRASERVVLTPNAVEAAWLAGREAGSVRSVGEALAVGASLCGHGFGAVVVKGGHLRGGPHDVLVTPEGATVFEGRRLPRTAKHRGTGCRFGAALAGALSRGEKIPAAVHCARDAIEKYLGASILGEGSSTPPR